MIVLLLVVLALLVVDWRQTRFIAKHPDRFYEINLILGRHPTLRAVDIYFACCVALTLAGAYFLPYWWAIGIGAAVLALELFITVRNVVIGVRLA